jgi:hypothetical protein
VHRTMNFKAGNRVNLRQKADTYAGFR